MIKVTTAFAIVALSALPTVAADGDPGIVEEMGERALARGYGTTCSLDHRPVRSGGYYPCLDFGPYRYVSGYGKIFGLVVQEGKEPFLVMSGAPGAASFLYDGPWNHDMPARMVMWWNETVEGTAAREAAENAASADRKAAEDYIRSLRGENKMTPHQPPNPPATAGTEEISSDIKQLLATQ